MIAFAGYNFDDHKAAIACRHVCDGLPVLLYVHDDEGDIHFMCGAADHLDDDLVVVGLSHLMEQVRAMSDIPTVDPGFLAERDFPGADWSVAAAIH